MSEASEQGPSGAEPRLYEGCLAKARAAAASLRGFAHRRALLLLWLGALALMLVWAVLRCGAMWRAPSSTSGCAGMPCTRLERASGGRVELERVEWNLPRLEFDLVGLHIHGTEAASEAPLLQVERARAKLRWAELFAGRFRLQQLQVLRPLVHVEVHPDGSTNIPGMKDWNELVAAAKSMEVLRVAVERAEVVDGRLDWNDRRIPLDGAVTGVFVQLGYRPSDHRYDGTARVGQVRFGCRNASR